MEWAYFVLGVIFYQIIKMLYLGLEDILRQRREKRFLKLVSVAFPDKAITYISIHGSDKKAIKELEADLRKQYHISEEPKKIPKYRRMAGSTR